MKERLKQLRKRLGLTQQELADEIGIKRTVIALCESGRNNLSETVLHLICRKFNVSETWLRNGTGDMFAPETTEALEAVARAYGLNIQEKELVQHYVELVPAQREYLLNMVKELSGFCAGLPFWQKAQVS